MEKSMDIGPQQIGKWLIVAGIFIILLGGLIILLGRFGLIRLPGDLEFGSRNWRFYFPIASCIVLSIILTLILWLINYFRR
jgi:predicted Co/Zn/Cd cation transporter (cation efflux family)